MDKDYVKVIQLLLQAENNVIEDSNAVADPLHFVYSLIDNQGRKLWEKTTFIDSPYLQLLKESGVKLNETDYDFSVLGYWASLSQSSNIRFSSSTIKTMLQMLLYLGADICAVDGYGLEPLQAVFLSRTLSSNEAEFHNTLEVATALLKNGADPYALNWFGRSVFNYAEDYDTIPVLLQSLERAGYDFNEVQEEVKRRQWYFNNPNHGSAESTAVDDTQVGPPSAKGLVLRRGARGDRLDD